MGIYEIPTYKGYHTQKGNKLVCFVYNHRISSRDKKKTKSYVITIVPGNDKSNMKVVSSSVSFSSIPFI